MDDSRNNVSVNIVAASNDPESLQRFTEEYEQQSNLLLQSAEGQRIHSLLINRYRQRNGRF